MTPLVSVVITTHNQPDIAVEALHSVHAQTYPAVETIVVDDGSTDDTVRQIKAAGGAHLISQPNAGVCRARNVGFAASTGELVMFLDGDDRLLADALEVQVARLLEADADFVVARARLIDPSGLPLLTRVPEVRQGDLYAALLREPWICPPSTVLMTRSSFVDVGRFDETIPGAGEDLDLYLRLARTRRGTDHDRVIVEYRVGAASLSRRYDVMAESHQRILERQRPHTSGNHALERARVKGLAQLTRRYRVKQVLSDVLQAVESGSGIVQVLAGAAPTIARHPRETVRIVRGRTRRGRVKPSRRRGVSSTGTYRL